MFISFELGRFVTGISTKLKFYITLGLCTSMVLKNDGLNGMKLFGRFIEHAQYTTRISIR